MLIIRLSLLYEYLKIILSRGVGNISKYQYRAPPPPTEQISAVFNLSLVVT